MLKGDSSAYIRPDQFNLLLLGYCEIKIGPSDQKKKKKAINWGVVIDHNLIKTDYNVTIYDQGIKIEYKNHSSVHKLHPI